MKQTWRTHYKDYTKYERFSNYIKKSYKHYKTEYRYLKYCHENTINAFKTLFITVFIFLFILLATIETGILPQPIEINETNTTNETSPQTTIKVKTIDVENETIKNMTGDNT
jgi:hypothetical protein